MAEQPTSRWGQWLQYCEARAKALNLAEIAGGSITRKKFAIVRNSITAGLFVSWGGLRPQRSNAQIGGIQATNESVVVAYPAMISIVRASNQNLAVDDRWFQWREKSEAAFTPRQQPAAAGLDWVDDILIDDGPILDPAAFGTQYDAQSFVVRAVGRERRGTV